MALPNDVFNRRIVCTSTRYTDFQIPFEKVFAAPDVAFDELVKVYLL